MINIFYPVISLILVGIFTSGFFIFKSGKNEDPSVLYQNDSNMNFCTSEETGNFLRSSVLLKKKNKLLRVLFKIFQKIGHSTVENK